MVLKSKAKVIKNLRKQVNFLIFCRFLPLISYKLKEIANLNCQVSFIRCKMLYKIGVVLVVYPFILTLIYFALK